MGGVKKKSMAAMEKTQESQSPGEEQTPAKGKKKEEKKSAPQQKKQLTFLPPKMSEPEIVKALAGVKAITIYSASRALGVNASIAGGVIRELEEKRLLVKAGGFSGHIVWAVAQAS